MGGEREITCTIDKQGNPALLSKKESIAQQFINGVFMAPGNIPNLPIGLNIEDFLYRDSIEPEDIIATLRRTCGPHFIAKNIGEIRCGIVDYNGYPMFWLDASILIDKEEKDSLGLVLLKQDNTVKFNYQFMSDSVKKAYGV